MRELHVIAGMTTQLVSHVSSRVNVSGTISTGPPRCMKTIKMALNNSCSGNLKKCYFWSNSINPTPVDQQTDKQWDMEMAVNTIKLMRVVLLSKISYPANNLRVNSDKTQGYL